MKLLNWLDRASVVISVAALVILTLEVCVSVVGRYIFNQPIPDDLVFSEYLMVVIVFLPLSSVQAAREHVFVTIFTEGLSNRVKAILETFGVFVGVFAFSVLAAATFSDFKSAWDYGSYVAGLWDLVEWPAKFAVFFGIALLAVRLWTDAVLSVIAIFKGTATATRSEEDRILDSDL